MQFFDLLNENTEMFVEATNIGIQPNMEGIMQINTEALQESFLLEASLVKVSNQTIINEGTAVLSENVFRNVYDKIAEIIKKMWAKVKEFFANLRTYFEKMVMAEGKFADKYENEIKGISSVKVEGFKLNPEAILPGTVWSKIQGTKVAFDSNTSSLLDKVSMDLVGKPAKQFKQGLSAKMGYKVKPEDITLSGAQIHGILSGLNGKINDLKKLQDATDKSYTEALKAAEAAKKEAANSEAKDADAKSAKKDAISETTKRINLLKDGLKLVNTTVGMIAGAYKYEAKLAKKAAYKGIAEGRKGSGKEEDK